jgi:hypothetical protein
VWSKTRSATRPRRAAFVKRLGREKLAGRHRYEHAILACSPERVGPIWRFDLTEHFGVRVEVGLQGLLVFPKDLSLGVASFDGVEVSAKRREPGLSVERVCRQPPTDSCPKFFKVPRQVVSADQPAAGSTNTREFTQSTVKILDVVEHPVAHHDVERIIVERQVLNVSLRCFQTSCLCRVYRGGD